MQWFDYPEKSEWSEIMARPAINRNELKSTIEAIFNHVRNSGDKAVGDYTARFDGISLGEFKVSQTEIADSLDEVTEELREAIQLAKKNIEAFHTTQVRKTSQVETMPGVNCWRKSVPIQKVGLYIPGGSAPLFSTVLMLAIPAQIAGCKEVILCSPPNSEGKIHPAILYSAQLCGVSAIYKVGGAQAIASMTIGTESIPKVDKLFGPGNQYVTEAKMYAQSLGTAIDMPAGPSEVLVVTDESSYPEFVAADLLSQAEHGPDSQVICVGTSEQILKDVQSFVDIQLKDLDRKEITQKALNNSSLVLLEEFEIMDFVNEYAAEHLILAIDDAEKWSEQVINAGSVFLGHLTPEAVGDYASGTNHTLPTSGYAKAYSGVSLDSFCKNITFQELTQQGIESIGPSVEIMATAEHLQAHKNAISVRLKALRNE